MTALGQDIGVPTPTATWPSFSLIRRKSLRPMPKPWFAQTLQRSNGKEIPPRAAVVFGAAALATLVAGVAIERSGEEFFARQGLSGILFGAMVLAAATLLPEVSNGLTSTKLGAYQLAISDIFGGNAFLPVLFLLAALISGESVLPAAHHTDIYLTRHRPDRRLRCRSGLPVAAPVPAHGHRQSRRPRHICRGHRSPGRHRHLTPWVDRCSATRRC
ncbi:hypothetical protein ACGFW5_33020 [Streptomyces sp. NPDC048416]|uniref:hypothetical protein n=1 Tax=Streptomyces sp. NPDC048416 TaxID=3365546 RepID=UPI0037125C75